MRFTRCVHRSVHWEEERNTFLSKQDGGCLRVRARRTHSCHRLRQAFPSTPLICGGSSHVRRVGSSLPLTARSPLTAQQYTQYVCLLRVATSVPFLRRSHSFRVLSSLAVSTRRGEGKGSAKTALQTSPLCPCRVSSGLPVRRSQRIEVRSQKPVSG